MNVLKYLSERSITLMDAGNLVSETEFFDDELFNFVKEKRPRRQFCDTFSRKSVVLASIFEKSDKRAVEFFFTIIFRTCFGFCAKV